MTRRWNDRSRLILVTLLGAGLLTTWACKGERGQAQTPAGGHEEEAAHHSHKPGESDSGGPHQDTDEASPHEHGPPGGAEEAGSITLSPEARQNIGLELATAAVHPIERTLALNATLQVDPDSEAFVSSRVQGKVTAVKAGIGDVVARGEPLVVLQSLQIAETPPTVEVPSPLHGTVLERSVTVGETVDPTKALFHIADLSHVLAQAEVYEADLARVRRGQAARVRASAYPDRVFAGHVVRLANAIDPERRTLRIWIDVPNTKDRLLKPDMFAQVTLVVASSGATVAVPNEAVQSQGPERFVFVQNGESFVRQNVVVGDKDDRYTAIKSGIVEGDDVVTRGAVELNTLASQPAGGGIQDESKPHTH